MASVILKDGQRWLGEKNMDELKVRQLVDQGIWTQADLARHGLIAVEQFVVPEGKVKVGEPRYVESKGKWSEVYDVEDAPPPPPELTNEEKLLISTGLTVQDLKELLA